MVGIGELGFVLLPDAWLGSGWANVKANTGGYEIGVGGGRWSSSLTVQGADGRGGTAADSSCRGLKIFELAGDTEDTKVVADGHER